MDDDSPRKTAEDVAYRSLALMALCYRASGEQSLARGADPDWEQFLVELDAWARDQGIADHYSETEEELMERPIGEIEPEELFALGWRLQALVATLWATGHLEAMPTYAHSVAAADVRSLMPLRKPVAEFLAAARLRPEEELRAERLRAEFWNWRARCDMFRRRGMAPPAGQTYEATITGAAEAAARDGLIAEVVAGDVGCDGRPYHALADQEFADAASTALERHHALNWICGDDDWDDVSTDT